MSGFNEHPGQTNRSAASAFLLVDSADRAQVSELNSLDLIPDFTQPINDFIIQKRQPFVSGYFNRLAVTECRFEYNSPNVNPRNNKLCVSGVTEEVITIPTNFYTPDELATAVQFALTATIPGQTWSVIYDDANQCFSIVSNQAFAIVPQFPPPEAPLYPTLTQLRRSLFYMMGFTKVNEEFEFTQVGNKFPSMCYTRYIDVCSRQLTQYQKVKDNSTRENQTPAVLLRIYLGNYTVDGLGDGGDSAKETWPGCRPCVIQRIMNVPKYSSWSPGQFIDQIDIQLRDDAGNLLYIPYNGDDDNELLGPVQSANQFQMTIHCSES